MVAMLMLSALIFALVVGCGGYAGRLPEAMHRWAALRARAQRPHERERLLQRHPRVLLKMDGEAGAEGLGGSPGLFSDFVVDESFSGDDDPPAAAADAEDDDDDWEGDGLDWDEPSGPEEPPDGVVVESIAKYLPQLMRKKYGDDWELLLADEDDGAEGGADGASLSEPAADGVVDVSASTFVDEVAYDDEDDEDGPSEEELRELVAKAGDDDDDDDESDDDEPMAGEVGVADLDVSHLAECTPEEIAESLSPKLADFLSAQLAGEVALPKPFPQSEWLHVFLAAFSHKQRFEELSCTWANLRVLLAENFDDLTTAVEDPGAEPDASASALLKARALHAATGMPVLAETTCVHVGGDGAKPPSETLYRVDERVDELLTRMRPSSAPEREVFYTSAAAFVSDDATFVGEGACSMPLGIAEARHATIATSTACDELFVKVAEGLGLKFVGSDAFEDFYKLQTLKKTGRLAKKTGGSMLLKEKILREATVLDASILKVSSFLNHMVDVELMEACGEELAERLEDTQPTKVLTVEATGLIPGMFVGKALTLPVVFARKSRQIGVSDSYQTSYKSSTKANSQDLYVSIEYLTPGDRVLIIDDFLAGGTTADALIRVCRMAGATVVGGGFLIEKSNDAGRAFLSGYEIPLESLCTVEIADSQVRIVETTGTKEEVSEWAKDQAELDRLLSADGRINLDFTVDAPPPPAEADAEAEVDDSEPQQQPPQQPQAIAGTPAEAAEAEGVEVDAQGEGGTSSVEPGTGGES